MSTKIDVDSGYAEILEHSLEAALLTRPDGTVLYANPAACHLFGYTLSELRELGRAGVVDYADPRLDEALTERLHTGRFRGELTMRRKDGSRFTADLSSALYTNAKGERRTSMFVRDVSLRQEREEALRLANAALTHALAEVRRLRGILPICSFCKRIRNDQHYWEQVEKYISDHAPVRFSHSVCPDCYRQHYHGSAG